jgi:hypothetical protein
MSQEQQPSLFKDLAKDFPDAQKAEFYKTMHESGISCRRNSINHAGTVSRKRRRKSLHCQKKQR